MLYKKRIEMIRSILEKDGCVRVSEMSDATGVTEKTIRQDLTKMEEMGIIERIHGGAVLKENNSIFPVATRKLHHMEEKKSIAKKAAELINDGDVIILDAGTTCLELAREIDNSKEIIVLSNDPLIIYELLHKDKVILHSTGGKLKREGSFVFVGSDARRRYRKYRATKCFVGTSAINLEQGLMVFSVEEAELKQEMIACSGQRICLVDSSKFNKTAFTSFATINQIDVVITDFNANESDINKLRDKGIEVLVGN